MHWRLFLTLAGLIAVWPKAGICDLPPAPPTSRTAANPAPLGLFGTVATISPYVGVLGYADGSNNYTVRGLGGFTADLFLAAIESKENNLDYGSVLYGIETGLLYSNLQNTSHAELVPIVFKGTRALGPRWFVDLTAGAELIHRELNSTMSLGRAGGSPDGDSFELFPALGANLSWKAGAWAAVSLRADYIPTPGQDLFSAMLGAVFPVG